jgi:hypothetical protein
MLESPTSLSATCNVSSNSKNQSPPVKRAGRAKVHSSSAAHDAMSVRRPKPLKPQRQSMLLRLAGPFVRDAPASCLAAVQPGLLSSRSQQVLLTLHSPGTAS